MPRFIDLEEKKGNRKSEVLIKLKREGGRGIDEDVHDGVVKVRKTKS